MSELDRQLRRQEENRIRILLAGDLAESISKRGGSLGVSYHETGHAIIGCLLRESPVEISIEAGDGSRGSGRVFFSEPTREMREAATPSDNEMIESIILANAGGEPMDLNKLRSETEAMLYLHWDGVRAVAEELFEKHHLGEAAIRRILGIAERGFPEFLPELPQSSTPEPASPRETTHG